MGETRPVSSERSRRGGRWLLRRADLSVGGGRLTTLSHRLLPEFTAALPVDEGLLLKPEPAPPSALVPVRDRRLFAGFLARLAALAAFLKFHGLGIAWEDALRIGSSPASPVRPWLGAVPVPEWRAVPPALLVGAVAVRLGGGSAGGRDAESFRRSVEEALESGRLSPEAAAFAAEALQLHATGGVAESLVPALSRHAREAAPDGPELLGLAYPSVSEGSPEGASAGVRAAGGEGALFVVRGASRSSGAGFVEISPADRLEEGASLRRLARALSGDPRAAGLGLLADGKEPGRWPEGPPLAVVALSEESWDARSRRAVEGSLGAAGFVVYETRAGATRPWESRVPLVPRLSAGDVASLLWLPFRSWSEAAESWDAVASASDDDPARFLRLSRGLAERFDPAGGGPSGKPLRKRLRPASDPLLGAAALLASGFTAEELSVAGGVPLEEAVRAVDAGCEGASLAPARDGGWRFTSEKVRAARAVRLSIAARRSIVERLEAGGVPAERLAVAALARGEAEDVRRASELLARTAEKGSLLPALDLLLRAPASDPDLGRPGLAVRVLAESGLRAEARAAARRLVPERAAGTPLGERSGLARRLARLGEEETALALVRGTTTGERLARVQVLLDLRKTGEAADLLDKIEELSTGASPAILLRRARLAAEVASRRGDLAAARRLLDQVTAVSLPKDDPGEVREVLMTAGFVALDEGRFAEARALFRRARDLGTDARSRADALLDAATASFHAADFSGAEEDLASALALYAEAGDEARYLSALGNRIDLAFRSGRYDLARETLGVVLRHESQPGREHQYLFAVPSRQRLARLDGDPEAAEAVFLEAESRSAAVGGHPAWREILILEGARLLSARAPGEALKRLEKAGELPDNREQTEPLRLRLLASARGDLGREPGRAVALLEPSERPLLAAEEDLRHGKAPRQEALRALESRLADGRGAAAVVERLLEWQGRFPEAFARRGAASLPELGRRAAARAGLAPAVALFAVALESVAAPLPSDETPAPALPFVAEDEATQKAVDEVRKVARTRLPVLILGETGTGKELLAREVHRVSGRPGPFVAVNVAALPGSLIESELFGHVRGAFTGADRDRTGLVEQASGGTLFLDEIGDLPLPLQAKLLRVLQEQELRRVGDLKTRKVDLRVVSATHRDLSAMADEGSFRRDLLYRITGLEASLPPLRRRPHDLRRLVADALGKATLTVEARAAVFGYAWPGNVRELLSALEAARALAAPSPVIGLEHLPPALHRAAAMKQTPEPGGSYRKAVAEAKRRAIEAALSSCDGNRTRAARMLGLSRQSLLYEMKLLGLAPPVHSGAWRSSGGSRGSRSSSGARRPSSSS
jgi:DNA-binding NtrC family response regulator